MSLSEPATVLSEKLDVLIRIQAALAVKDLPTQKEKIFSSVAPVLDRPTSPISWGPPRAPSPERLPSTRRP